MLTMSHSRAWSVADAEAADGGTRCHTVLSCPACLDAKSPVRPGSNLR